MGLDCVSHTMQSVNSDRAAVIQTLSEYAPVFQQEHRTQLYADMDITRDDISASRQYNHQTIKTN